jgi:hypothetical protein
METESLLAYQLRVAVVILEDAARSIRTLPQEQRSNWMSQLVSSLVAVLELQKEVYARRPDLDPRKGTWSSGSSADVAAHRRVSSALAKAYLLVAEGQRDAAASLLTKSLSHEPSEFHQEWLQFEISQLRSINDT